MLKGIPDDEENYSRAWIRQEFLKVIKKHGARVLNPALDITFTSADTAVILVDGFDHMVFEKDEELKN